MVSWKPTFLNKEYFSSIINVYISSEVLFGLHQLVDVEVVLFECHTTYNENKVQLHGTIF